MVTDTRAVSPAAHKKDHDFPLAGSGEDSSSSKQVPHPTQATVSSMLAHDVGRLMGLKFEPGCRSTCCTVGACGCTWRVRALTAVKDSLDSLGRTY